MDLPAYLRLVRGHWRLIAATAIVGVLLGVASWWVSDGLSGSESHYRATHTLVFDPPPADAAWAFQNLDQVALLATGGDVPTHVAEAFGTDAGGLTQRTTTVVDPDSGTIDISVIGREAKETEKLADAVADGVRDSVNTQELAGFQAERDRTTGRLQTLTDDLAKLDARLASASGAERELLTTERTGVLNQYWFTYEQFQQFAAQGDPTARLTTFNTAASYTIGTDDYDELLQVGARGENNVSTDSDSPVLDLETGSTSRDGVLPRGVLGGFLGGLAGLGLAFAIDRITQRLRSREEVERAFAAPVLAEIPRLDADEQRAGAVVAVTTPRSRAAEAYRAVRSLLMLRGRLDTTGPNGESGPAPGEAASARGDGLVVMVASASPDEGKTTTAANLAAVFAEAGASVLAVSCDFHRPRLHFLLDAAGAPRTATQTAIAGVSYMSAVTDDPAATPPRTVALQRQLVDEARQRFDVVVLDTAPLLTTNDATELVPAVDLVVLVARAGVTTLGAAERARQLLGHLGATVAGVVLLDPYRSAKDPYYDARLTTAKRGGVGRSSERLGSTPPADEPEPTSALSR